MLSADCFILCTVIGDSESPAKTKKYKKTSEEKHQYV